MIEGQINHQGIIYFDRANASQPNFYDHESGTYLIPFSDINNQNGDIKPIVLPQGHAFWGAQDEASEFHVVETKDGLPFQPEQYNSVDHSLTGIVVLKDKEQRVKIKLPLEPLQPELT